MNERDRHGPLKGASQERAALGTAQETTDDNLTVGAPGALVNAQVATRVALLDYQDTAAKWLCRRLKGMVVSPAGSGKTIIAAAALSRVICRRVRAVRVRVGWVANTIEQCQQAVAAIARFPSLSDAIDLTIACPAGMPADATFDVLIVDEAHHAPAATWAAIILRHTGCLWFFTATPFGSDIERNAELRAMVAGNIHMVPRSVVASRVVPAYVIMLDDTDANLRDRIDEEIKDVISRRRRFSPLSDEDLYRQTAPHACMSIGIVPNKARNAAIVRTATAHAADSTLVLVSKIEHGEMLQARIPVSVLAFSKMGKAKRRDAIAAFRAGDVRCLLATSLADEGLDVPAANVLIMAGAGRSPARIEQRSGRVLRAHEGKTHGTIYDFVDDIHSLLASQSRARQSVYRGLGYSIRRPKTALSTVP